MKTQHTPAPWKVSFSQINAGEHECIVQFGFNIRENPKAFANARLIAESPKLLNLLIELKENREHGKGDAVEIWGRINTSIKAVTGE